MKEKGSFKWLPVAGTVALAAAFWFFAFYVEWGIFWFKISLAAASLAALSFYLHGGKSAIDFRPGDLLLGLASAALLYAVFWAGKSVSTAIFPFAADQIGAVYGKRGTTSLPLIALLLFFVTGPCEEIYWRGYLQNNLVKRFGRWPGFLLATTAYAGVHIWAMNFMLLGAAAVAGAFWGFMYMKTRRLAPVIVSHSIWSTVIFAALPV